MPKTIRDAILLSLTLLLIAQAMFMPMLLVALLIVVLLVFAVSSQKQHRLPKAVNFAVILLALGIVYIQYGTFLGIEAGVAILISFLFAKVIESHQPRDWLVVFNFALFVSASSFLYSSSVWMTLLMLLSLTSCLVGFYRLHQLKFKIAADFPQDARQVAKVLGYALPFFMLLFLFFPRLPPLWHMPLQGGDATTGMSDSMAPGDIANLSQSSELAFRIVTNIAALPPQSQLYWRAMVLDEYDGYTWTASQRNQQPLFRYTEQPIARLNYQYLAAEKQPKWIMGLETSVPSQPGYYVQHDGAIRKGLQRHTAPIDLIWLGKQNIHPISVQVLKANQNYLSSKDLQAQRLAQELFKQSGVRPEVYIAQVLNWYKSQGFGYNLNPGRLQNDHIDDFLFRQRQGFCEHYASSFVMLMRYVGIPARVVVGYQGGQAAPDGKTWEVRQLDAHAWSEVWLKGQWQRIDPTAVIAPERIESGIQTSLLQQSEFKQQQWAWRNRMQVWSDFVAYQWQSKVVGYDQNRQVNWLSQFGLSTPLRLALFMISAIALLMILVLAYRYVQIYRQQSPYERNLHYFNCQLALPLQKQHAESHAAWLLRLSQQLDAESAQFLVNLAAYDQQWRYGQHSPQKLAPDVKKMLKKCALELNQTLKPLF
ncbi:DUF3488 and transglutaminase-like domain-containing protein [uncultured Acinetobacter sp.]|uniref:transglutaminase family protein n=1 Tax=uncultured Acinetobacter sp. TaxID=165433 RepID=UPI00260CCA94|nr:DUF3488 and transglutaminase-like domain-containing protein [uncultured Acinetobacter sp.]